MAKILMLCQLVLLILFCYGCSPNDLNQQDPNALQKIAAEDTPNPPQNAMTLNAEDFVGRWNAISEEQMSDLHINSLKNSSATATGAYDYVRLKSTIELRVYKRESQISKLEIISDDKTPSTVLQMLTSWSQIIEMLHQNNEIDHVDTIFNKIGVGPNSDITDVKQQSFDHFGVRYEVIPTDSGFTFRAVLLAE